MITNYWMSPETTSVNRLPMLNIEHIEKISLNGTWRFQLLHSPLDRIDKKWSTIPVPGLWTMQPESDVFFDKPIYTNVQMPFEEQPPQVPAENPHGVYERDFEIPDSWKDKRIVLHLGGYESVALVSVNGVEVGLTKDSRLAAEFDVTQFVRRGSNVLRIDVTKWSDATFIEDQDQWWHGGITRSVKLFATNKVFIERFYTTAGLEKDCTTGTLNIRAYIASIDNLSSDGYTLRTSIEELAKVKSAKLEATIKRFSTPLWTERDEALKLRSDEYFHGKFWHGNMPEDARRAITENEPWPVGKVEFNTKIPKIQPWSAENPNLYTLNIELIDPTGNVVEVSQQKIGFRSVEIKGQELLLNGQPVMFYGINRHDFNRFTGRALTRDDMREDLLELKRWNFNAVRTSHYPNDAAFLDLCDELGFYVIGEANIESHAFIASICDDPKYLTAFVDRVGRMIQRDIHHPAAVMWSLGNESGAGTNHEAAAAYARNFDPSRPLHYEGGIRGNWMGSHSLTDVIAPMYPAISAIKEYANSNKADRPLIMCEYSHAMGNANGTLAEYWDVIESTHGLQGGFIWEFWDHGPVQTMPDGSTRNAYGGDYGEVKHDGNFCCDGMVFPDRTAKPAMHEFKSIAAPAKITSVKASTGNFKIFNKNFFKDLSEYELYWTITRDGIICDSGKVKLPKVAPRKNMAFTVKSPLLSKADGTGERFINFSIVKIASTAWSPTMSEVGWSQLSLPSRSLSVKASAQSELFANVVDDYGQITLPYGVLAPVLSLWRAPTDNDRIGHIATKWNRWGLRDLERSDCIVSQTSKRVMIANIWLTSTGIEIKHTQTITPVAHGFRVKESVTLPKSLVDVARIGTNFELRGELSDLTWFGSGPHETYPDRKIARINRYISTVAEQYIPYVRPQENGGHNGVRWFELTNANGNGLRVQLNKPLQVSITPNRAIDLADATHNVEIKPCGNTVVHIDAAHRGVGTAACGPDTLPQYLIKSGLHTWEWVVTTI
ncbi:MAG: glycoside hydrolase family 2 TIM barrel-domain containing protein [Candidatus Planktophila sp.]|nr:glycoside hydrolase family 2 TIM barrel-domain containing protein [Candidatus Planktophila sp.]